MRTPQEPLAASMAVVPKPSPITVIANEPLRPLAP